MRDSLIGVSMIAVCAAQMSTGRAHAQTVPPGSSSPQQGKSGPEEVIVTATKRSEKLQKVPLAVQVLDSKTLAQHDVNSFQDYLKLVPSLTTQTLGPNQTSIYLRGISSGDNANHSGPLPTVGSYLDELPITTIGGTLDVHPYDMARIEVLPGPQGTLYGASSEAGTVRIITNKPDPSHFSAGYSVEGNNVDHGNEGYVTEGFVNIPINNDIAVRLVAFDEHDSGYIDNVFGTRTFPTTGGTLNNSTLLRNGFNPADTFGGRAALKVDLDEDWSITPTIMGQDLRTTGTFGFEPAVGDLEVQRFQPDTDHDRWALAGLTVNGRVGNFDLTYAGSLFVRDVHQRLDYTDYSIAYDQAYGSAHYWQDSAGNPLPTAIERQDNKDHFNKVSNEIRLASPATDRIRFLVGAFQELQTHLIQQDYLINGFGSQLAIPGWPDSIWLTKQRRTDRDYAAFTELAYDIIPSFTVTAGVRPYYYDNSLFGYYGYSEGYDALTGFDTGEGAMRQNCIAGEHYGNAPCVDLNKSVTGSGETHKVNLSYKIDDLRMMYFTYSTGYRPGGVNRNGMIGPYAADTLTNFEVGLKSQWFNRRLTLNVSLYDEDWNNFQFSFLGLNSLTVVQNAPAANVKGIETAASFSPIRALTLSGDLTLENPKLVDNFCGADVATGVIIKTCSNADAVAARGTQLPYTSTVKGSVNARYNFPLLRRLAGHVQATLSFQSHSQVGLRTVDKDALGSIPAFATLDLFAGFDYHALSFELFAKNVADERGQENRYVSCTVGVCNDLYVLPIQPRIVGLRLSQKF